MSEPDVLIVGGGISGLTLAIALAEQGREALVVDTRPDWDIAGWGLSLTGPALRALDALGLADDCLRDGYGITRVTNCTSSGETLDVIEPPLLNGPTRPAMVGIFRPLFHRILLERTAKNGTEIRLATTVDRFADDGKGGVDVTLTDGTQSHFGLVVGADGVQSPTRRALDIGVEPSYTGQVVWRALVERPEWGTSTHTFAGPVHNAGLIPISETHAYVFLTESTDRVERFSDDELVGKMHDLLAGFTGPIAEVRDAITDPSAIVRRPVEVLIAPAPWHRGGVVLIGDAVHSPSPQLISGAALAIEDAVVLAEEFGADVSTETALARFSERRYERCRLVVDNSVQVGQWDRENRHADSHALQSETFAALAAAT